MTAPDRIIMDCGYTPNENGVALFASWNEPTEYVRADLVPPAAPEVAALVEAAEVAFANLRMSKSPAQILQAKLVLERALAALRGNGGAE